MSNNKLCFYKEADKKTWLKSQKTTKSSNCGLIGLCAVIRSNTVFCASPEPKSPWT